MKQANTAFSIFCARTALGMLLSLPFLQPLHSMPIPSFYSEWLAVILGLLASVFCLPVFLSEKRPALKIPYIVSLPMALLALVLMQALFGKFVYVSSAAMVLALLLWAACVMLACSIVVQYSSVSALSQHLAKWLMVAGLLSALLGILQSWGIAPYLPGLVIETQSGSGVYGNLAQQNHFATYLACGLAASLYLFQQGQLRLHRLLFIASSLVFAMLLSRSRSVVLYVAICAFWFAPGWKLTSRFPKPALRPWLLFAMAICALALLILINTEWGKAQLHRYGYWTETIGARVFLWKHACWMWLQAPVMGVGWDSFAAHLVEQIGQTQEVNPWGVDQYAHNLIVQLAAVSGLLGVLALILPLGFLLHRLRRTGIQKHQKLALAVLSILCLHSLLEQPLYYSYFLGLAACMLVCVESSFWELRLGVSAWFASLLLASGVVLSALTMIDFRFLEGHFDEGSSASSGVTEEQILAMHQRSFFSAIFETLYPQLFVPHTASVQAKLNLNTRLMQQTPIADTQFRQAALLAEAGQVEAAEQRLKIAAYAYPAELDKYAQRFAILAQNEPEKYTHLALKAQEMRAMMARK